MDRVRINEIKPEGWLNVFLKAQSEGLTGHIERAGYPFNVKFWKGERFEGKTPPWEVFEQTAYWIDGAYCCGVLLGDEKLTEKADEYLSYVVENAAEDGFIGPDSMRKRTGWFRWPHVVLFRALMAKYSVTKDEKILRAIKNFYLKNDFDYSCARDFLNIEIMLFAYGESKDERLLALAEKTYDDYHRNCGDHNNEKFMLSNKKPYAHGVTYCETSKIGAILYIYTKNERYLQSAIKAFDKIDKYFMLADGGICSDEFLIDNDYMQSHETCTVTDYTWALYYLLMATHEVKYADKIEKCIFNAGISCVNEDFTALQYLCCANKIVVGENSSHNLFFKGKSLMQYAGKPFTECCTGNVNRFMPNFCRHLWMQEKNTVYATMYGANTTTFDLKGNRVTIKERTNYPFEEKIVFEFSMDAPTNFILKLRIPAWSKTANVYLNGKLYCLAKGGRFKTLKREFKNGDKVELELFAKINVSYYNNDDDGVVVSRGPLVYALGMKGDRKVLNQGVIDEFPTYEIYPNKPWNYGVNGKKLRKTQLTLNKRQGNFNNPWDINSCPYSIDIPAQKLNNWNLVKRKKITRCTDLYNKTCEKVEGDFIFLTRFPNKKLRKKHLSESEIITLVPCGTAKIRITVFPNI